MKKTSLIKLTLPFVVCGLLTMSCHKSSSGGADDPEEPEQVTPTPTPTDPTDPTDPKSDDNKNQQQDPTADPDPQTNPDPDPEPGTDPDPDPTTEPDPKPATYTLTFDANGATGSIDAMTLPTTEAATIPDASTLTYDGHVFVGWNTDKDSKTSTYDAGSKYDGTSSATLYAIWTKVYKITYHYDPQVPDTKQTVTFTGRDFDSGTITIHHDVALEEGQVLTWKDQSGNQYQDGQTLDTATDLEVWADISKSASNSTTAEKWNYKTYTY